MSFAEFRRDYTLPFAIIAAGAILAVAIYAVRTEAIPVVKPGTPDMVRPVTIQDRIIGSPEALVKLVEYADIDSPNSKRFQATLAQVMSEYAAEGQVAWVYRHFPLLDRHPFSAAHAEAAECAGFVGGNDAFWRFIDALQAAAPGESQFPREGYPDVARQLGIAETPFMECLQNGRFTKKVYDDSENAIATGADGAPYTIVLVEGQPPVGIQGALTYEDLRRVIDDALTKVP